LQLPRGSLCTGAKKDFQPLGNDHWSLCCEEGKSTGVEVWLCLLQRHGRFEEVRKRVGLDIYRMNEVTCQLAQIQ